MNEKLKLKPDGILKEVTILFFVGTLVIGMFTYFTQQVLTDSSVRRQTQNIASDIAAETMTSIREYPAYQWLISYWRNHSDEMDIEYDTDFSSGTETEKKVRALNGRYPDLQLKYATTDEILALPEEDQKLYAEIVYSWLITRFDQIKTSHEALSFLFCCTTNEKYNKQFFLLSGADPGAVRGTEYEQVYTLGVTSGVSESQQEGMRRAHQNNENLADAGSYVDYYAYMEMIGDEPVMIGLTYDQTELNDAINHRTAQGTGFAMILEVILAWGCLAMMIRFVLQPLKEIQENIRIYKNTKNGSLVRENLENVRPANEIGQLSEDICDLTTEVDDYLVRIRKISEEKERINVELSLAKGIQADMLPSTFPAFPDRDEFDVFASMTPAKEVGGDFYNLFEIDEDHLCVLIADVSGKGIPAAMFMMASQIILKSLAEREKSPAKIMEAANATLCENKHDMFVTVWMGILEISTGVMNCVNAGHEYPAVRRNGERYELLKDTHGMIVGGLEGVKYREYELKMEPGDRVFVYTDGVPEATDADNYMFGTERMLAALDETADTPMQTLENVTEAVNRFIGDAEQFDDLTMLCLEYSGKNGGCS